MQSHRTCYHFKFRLYSLIFGIHRVVHSTCMHSIRSAGSRAHHKMTENAQNLIFGNVCTLKLEGKLQREIVRQFTYAVNLAGTNEINVKTE